MVISYVHLIAYTPERLFLFYKTYFLFLYLTWDCSPGMYIIHS